MGPNVPAEGPLEGSAVEPSIIEYAPVPMFVIFDQKSKACPLGATSSMCMSPDPVDERLLNINDTVETELLIPVTLTTDG